MMSMQYWSSSTMCWRPRTCPSTRLNRLRWASFSARYPGAGRCAAAIGCSPSSVVVVMGVCRVVWLAAHHFQHWDAVSPNEAHDQDGCEGEEDDVQDRRVVPDHVRV